MSGDTQSSCTEKLRVAVLLPCYNEAKAIEKTVSQFKAALPQATIYVYDNNSSDDTAIVAAQAGAIVATERTQGKGHVVRRMFADIEADIYVLADGDATYDAASAGKMVNALTAENLDMVVGSRVAVELLAYRRGHRFGNRLMTGLLTWIFGRTFTDILSGYRVFSRRFVKSFPALSAGFEIETEISIHALALRMPVTEISTSYAPRGEGSFSKLSTMRDGWRILSTIITMFRNEKPLTFFGIISALVMFLAAALSVPLAITYLETGLVPRLPTAVLVTGLAILAALCVFAGLILDTVALGRREMRRLAYLAHPAVGSERP